MTRDGTTLTIDVFVLVPILAILAGLVLILWRRGHRKPPNENTDDTPGFSIRALLAPIPLPEGIKLAGFGLWAVLFATLGFGVFFAVITALIALPSAGEDTGFNLLRGALITVAAITATLGAVVALPFTIRRSIQTERQTSTQEEGYVTQQINEAVANLAAQKEVNKLGRNLIWIHDDQKKRGFQWYGENFDFPDDEAEAEFPEDQTEGEWKNVALTEPNIEVRIGAILALERLARQRADIAVREKNPANVVNRTPDGILDHDAARDHVRIMELICAYICENAAIDSAKEHHFSEGLGKPAIEEWTANLEPPRTDIQIALAVLGRRTKQQRNCEGELKSLNDTEPGDLWHGYRLNLIGTNLQAARLAHSDSRPMDLSHSVVIGARLEGANLYKAKMNGSDLSRSQLDGAVLPSAHFENAKLNYAKLDDTDLRRTHLTNASLEGASLVRANLRRARAMGANLDKANLTQANLRRTRLQGATINGGNLHLAAIIMSYFDRETTFHRTSIRGACLRGVTLWADRIDPDCLTECFGDASVVLEGKWPDGFATQNAVDVQHADTDCNLSHWSPEVLQPHEFEDQWRAFQEAFGYQSEDPN